MTDYGNRLVFPNKADPSDPRNLDALERWANSHVVNKIVAGDNVSLTDQPLSSGPGASGTGVVTLSSTGGAGGSLTPVHVQGWQATSASLGLGWTPTVGNLLILVVSGNGGTSLPISSPTKQGIIAPVLTGVQFFPVGNLWPNTLGTASVKGSMWIGIVYSSPGVGASITWSQNDTTEAAAIAEISGSKGRIAANYATMNNPSTTSSVTMNGLSGLPGVVLAYCATRGSPYGAVNTLPTGMTSLIPANGAVDGQGAVAYQSVDGSAASLVVNWGVASGGGGFTTPTQLFGCVLS